LDDATQSRQTTATVSVILSILGFWCWMAPEIGIIICSITVIIGHYSRHAILPRFGRAGVFGRNLSIVGIFLHVFVLNFIG
jgi:hypothetical protein